MDLGEWEYGDDMGGICGRGNCNHILFEKYISIQNNKIQREEEGERERALDII